jgi:uncharacterized SAM-binding protein YcdF (DUF218 family)
MSLFQASRVRYPVTLTLAALGFAGIVMLASGFYFAGRLLLVESQPRQADVGVVLAGHFARASYAADLYRQGLIQRVWVTRPVRENGLTQLDALGIPYPRQEEINRAVLLKKGVPPDRIEIIGGEVASTIAEARLVADLLKAKPEIHSLLVVTTKAHVRRASAIFCRVIGDRPQTTITVVGAPDDGFVADRWWTDRESARQVVLETAKLMLFWVATEL